MPNFVEMPYLPTAKVTHILAGVGMRAYGKALSDLQIACIYSKSADKLSVPVNAHADISVLPFGGKHFILDKSQTELFKKLKALGANPQFSYESIADGYPQEARLNCVRIGNRLFGNPKTMDAKILEYCKNCKVSICAVNQGYTKCSVAVIAENALITDDVGIAHMAKSEKMDVLSVEKGSILLNGYPYGFIGGCCSLAAKDILLFTGNWQRHSNAEAISAFLQNYHIYPESLSNGKLTDIGSFIPLFQQEEVS